MSIKKHPTQETEHVVFPVQTTYGNEYKVKQKVLSLLAPTSEKLWKRSWKPMDEIPEWITILEELKKRAI